MKFWILCLLLFSSISYASEKPDRLNDPDCGAGVEFAGYTDPDDLARQFVDHTVDLTELDRTHSTVPEAYGAALALRDSDPSPVRTFALIALARFEELVQQSGLVAAYGGVNRSRLDAGAEIFDDAWFLTFPHLNVQKKLAAALQKRKALLITLANPYRPILHEQMGFATARFVHSFDGSFGLPIRTRSIHAAGEMPAVGKTVRDVLTTSLTLGGLQNVDVFLYTQYSQLGEGSLYSVFHNHHAAWESTRESAIPMEVARTANRMLPKELTGAKLIASFAPVARDGGTRLIWKVRALHEATGLQATFYFVDIPFSPIPDQLLR